MLQPPPDTDESGQRRASKRFMLQITKGKNVEHYHQKVCSLQVRTQSFIVLGKKSDTEGEVGLVLVSGKPLGPLSTVTIQHSVQYNLAASLVKRHRPFCFV